MPDLVTRLAGLHATLTARLSLRESLLSLSGRLDMVLQQVDLRSSAAPAPMASRGKKGKAPAHADTPVTRRYVEGESDEEDVMEVELEEGSDTGSIEDVELGATSESEVESDAEEEEEEEEEEDGEDSEGDSEGDEGPRLNGFIDDEAEEDEEDSESE